MKTNITLDLAEYTGGALPVAAGGTASTAAGAFCARCRCCRYGCCCCRWRTGPGDPHPTYHHGGRTVGGVGELPATAAAAGISTDSDLTAIAALHHVVRGAPADPGRCCRGNRRGRRSTSFGRSVGLLAARGCVRCCAFVLPRSLRCRHRHGRRSTVVVGVVSAARFPPAAIAAPVDDELPGVRCSRSRMLPRRALDRCRCCRYGRVSRNRHTHRSDTTNVHGIADTSTLYRSGGTDVAVADGGTTGATTANARANLGTAIGTDVRRRTTPGWRRSLG